MFEIAKEISSHTTISEVSRLPDRIGKVSEVNQLPDRLSSEHFKLTNERLEISKNGGSYKEVKDNTEGNTHEVHHMPADSASPLERNDGPAIKMEREDHRQTASCGSSIEAREYRAQQKNLIDQGNFREALQMDINDIHEHFNDKYDGAIAEMLEYVNKLEKEGKIHA